MAFNNLSEIIYEEIEGTSGAYGWGKYGEFKVLIRKSDGYINATKLCKDGGKEFFNWSQCVGSNELVSDEVAFIAWDLKR